MQENSPKPRTPKRYSSYNLEKPEGRPQNGETEYQSPQRGISSSSKIGDEEKPFVFSLNSFQKSASRKESNEAIDPLEKSTIEDSFTANESFDPDKESRRKIIYGNESFKQKQEEQELITTTVQSNNDLFSLVFLNKSKPAENISQPTNTTNSKIEAIPPTVTGSFSKQKLAVEPTPAELLSSEDYCPQVGDFQLGKKLGAGKFGQVYLAKHRATGFVLALKKIQKSKIDNKLMIQLVRQIKIQIFLNHPNVVKMYTFFSDATYIYLAMELCYSGQLYGYLKKKRRIPEEMTKNIVQQICRALDYMHENEIIHRDLKPENIIYQSGLVKICDFGWSISTNTMRVTFCGTPLYVSPELLKRKSYNNKIDVWSVGILTYELLFGKVPFQIQTEQDFIKIVEDEIKFSKITKISDDAKNFILSCLQKDPRDRYTIPELLQHPFLNKLENVSMVDMY